MKKTGRILLWCCLAAIAGGGDAATPELAKPFRAVDRQPPPSRVEELQPSIYYLPDKQGELQAVLDFRYPDFVELYKLKNRLVRNEPPPRYSLQRLSTVGTVVGAHAELTVRCQVLLRDDDWVRAPLRLDQGLLGGVKGTGQFFVEYDADGGGYFAWLRGKPDTKQEITLTLLTPVEEMGDETRLKLSFPQAAVSEMKLTVPTVRAVGTVSEGAALLSAATAVKGGTEFSIIGPAKDFSLAWRQPKPAAAETSPVLEASCVALARLDGREIFTEAALSVRSYGETFDRFVVRLPPGAEWVADRAASYVVAPVETSGQGAPRRPRSVEVRLPKKTAGPVEVRLNCRRGDDSAKGGEKAEWSELSGFEVVGAVRQWGVMAVAVAEDWQVVWGPRRRVRSIDLPLEALRKEHSPTDIEFLTSNPRKDDIVAGFEYFSQPYSLPVRLTPRKTRVRVDPEYILSVERDRICLEGRLNYTIRGAKASGFDVAMPGWEIDEVAPDSAVAVEEVMIDPDRVRIPLKRPMSGVVEVRLQAHRAIPPRAKTFEAPLPRPKADSAAAASVAVTSADNVELAPDARRTVGLTRQWDHPPMPLPTRQQRPLYYRGTGGDPVFAADFRTLPQHISVAIDGRATISKNTATVRQNFLYTVAHEPVEQFVLNVPAALAKAGPIEVLCDGKSLDVVWDDDKQSMKVALPGPQIGDCALEVRYSAAVSTPMTGQSAHVAIPLVMPADGELASHRVTVLAGEGLRVATGPDGWKAADSGTSDEFSTELQLAATQRLSNVDLRLRGAADGSVGTVVDRAWIQTWLTSQVRQDRAIYQVLTDREELDIFLPSGAAADAVVALVDGKQVEPRLSGENRLRVPLADATRPGFRRATIELRYHFPGVRPAHGTTEFDFPRLASDAWMRRIYWQLVLPVNEHLIVNPDGWTGEFAWRWNDYFWGRQPLLEQAELESWSGAAMRDPLPERTNRYLFSTLGRPQRTDVRTAGRTWIVLWASGAALVAGLLLIYVPIVRRPASLFVVFLGLSAAWWIAPEPTILLAQAAALGLALALLAGFLERGVARRRRLGVVRERSNSWVEVATSAAGDVGSTRVVPPIANERPSAAIDVTKSVPTPLPPALGETDP